MLGFQGRSTGTVATINAQPVRVQQGETILTAALREGVDFPHSCRVGGCASCKCKLVEGRVRELTEFSYLLSEEELSQRTILACQSVPMGPVRIEVEQTRALAVQEVAGTVVAQEALTHDIQCLRVRLDAPLHYKPGQFAQLSLDALPGQTRSYSFANPPDAQGVVEFFVRQVPGGAFTGHVHGNDLLGQRAHVQGPLGQFWLRESDAPLLFVAGGSGLAPVLAMLRALQQQGSARSVTVLFGARTQADLYGMDELRAMAAGWAGAFRLVPVLSEAQADAGWAGGRGLVTEQLPQVVEPGMHAYLCGPPAMVDAAHAALVGLGLARAHIHADRFVTQKELSAPEKTAQAAIETIAPPKSLMEWVAAVWHYLKFFLFHVEGLAVAAALFAGGSWITVGLLVYLLISMGLDLVAGDDTSTPTYRHPWILTVQLWMALPLLLLICFAAVWSVSPGDALGAGAMLSQWTGMDLLAAKSATTWYEHALGVVLMGLMVGMVGTVPGHELTHRTWDPVSLWVGRWLLAFSFDVGFAIEHVYGHHRYVSTLNDPATAPRGRNVYAHVLISTIRGNISAWRIEAGRLQRKGLPVLSWHNAYLRGLAMSAVLVAAAFGLGGVGAALYFCAFGLTGKALLEIVNYMEHYGIVRDPAQPVQPRHSWNTNSRISSWALFNLTRHSHHHAQGEVPYQDLQPYPHAPMMIGGYLTTISVAMIPPLWHKLMTPKVLAWDRDYANAAEKQLAAQASARAGWV
ncbi:fatty acid desaturase [Curvibacter sp. APW13]|uniref:fatty acid desaturase n=1 Tax=Curvibacter sp. APW13 TaxID=3077236 RepID=UPI0028DFFA8F|nr:fatty acid desaturase [Curvibacter sp. APW13]MDT8991196.1 fatty acid desaturase [Curvibacter sp. APW13]